MARSFKMELKIIYISLINQSSLILILVPFFFSYYANKKIKMGSYNEIKLWSSF